MEIKVLKSIAGIFLAQKNVSIQVCHIIEIMRRDFSEHHQMQVPITESPLETMTKMSQIAEQVCLDYPEIPDKYVTELVIDFLFLLGGKKDLWRTHLQSLNQVSEPPSG